MEDLIKLGELFPKFMWEILMALICGGLIGLERQLRQSGGLRNNVLICLGSVLYMIVAEIITISNGDNSVNSMLMSSSVVVGIGLLGIGIMVQSQSKVSGIHRAATFWIVAAIGLIIGNGHPMLALLITAIILLTLTLLHFIEKQFNPKKNRILLRLTLREDNSKIREKLHTLLEKHKISVDRFRSEQGPRGVKITIESVDEASDLGNLITELWTVNGVIEVEH